MMFSKKVAAEEKKVAAEEKKEIYLEEVDMLKLELITERYGKAKLEVEKFNVKTLAEMFELKLKLSELEIARLNTEEKLKTLENTVEGLKRPLITTVEGHYSLLETFRLKLKNKYSIKKDVWGYNPDTLEIIE